MHLPAIFPASLGEQIGSSSELAIPSPYNLKISFFIFNLQRCELRCNTVSSRV